MRIAHTAIVTPHRAGLYESVRDIVAAERAKGADAFIWDPQAVYEDRGVPIGSGNALMSADVVINHSGLGAYETQWGDRPIIHCLHGRPESSFRLESNGNVGVYSFVRSTCQKPGYRLWVTFWARYEPYWGMLVPRDKLRTVTAPVDLQQWTPDGPSGYKFAGRRGDINIVCTDMWREDVTPYHSIHAACLFAESHPGCRLHLYGVQRTKALDVLLTAVSERGILGEVAGIVDGLANVYRAATMLISPHVIATRAVREALACGCPAVWNRNPQDLAGTVDEMERVVISTPDETARLRANARQTAIDRFDSRKTARELLALADEVMTCHA